MAQSTKAVVAPHRIWLERGGWVDVTARKPMEVAARQLLAESPGLSADSPKLNLMLMQLAKLTQGEAMRVAKRGCYVRSFAETYGEVDEFFQAAANERLRRVRTIQANLAWKRANKAKLLTRAQSNEIASAAAASAKRYKMHRAAANVLLRSKATAMAKGINLLSYLAKGTKKAEPQKVSATTAGPVVVSPPALPKKVLKVKPEKRAAEPIANVFQFLGVEEPSVRDTIVARDIFAGVKDNGSFLGPSVMIGKQKWVAMDPKRLDPWRMKIVKKLVGAGLVRTADYGLGYKMARVTLHEIDLLASYCKKRRGGEPIPKARPGRQPVRKPEREKTDRIEVQARIPNPFRWIPRPKIPVKVDVRTHEEVATAIKSIGESVQKISDESLKVGIDTQTAELISEATSSIDSALNGDAEGPGVRQSVHTAAEALKNVADKLGEAADNCGSGFNKMVSLLKIVGVLVGAYVILKNVPRLRKHASLIIALAGVAIPLKLWDKIKPHLPSWFDKGGDSECTSDSSSDTDSQFSFVPEVQSAKIDEEGIGALTKIAIIAVCFVVPVAKGTINVSRFIRDLGAFDAAAKGAMTVSKFLITLFERLVNALRACVGKGPTRILATQSRRVDDWISRVDKATSDIKHNKVKATVENVGALDVLVKQGYHLLADATTPPMLRTTITTHINRLTELLDNYGPLISQRPTVRVEPAVFMMSGEPRIGKTTLMNSIAMYVCKERVNPVTVDGRKDYQRYIYSKTADPFWEGYINQPVIAIDDFGKDTVAKGSEGTSDYAQTIALVNMWSVPLRMAALELKGKTFLVPEAIICSTNLYAMTSVDTVLESPDAFFGRLHFPYKVHLRDNWSTRDSLGRKVFDIAMYNFNMEMSKGKCVFSPWLAEPWDYKEGKSKGAKVPFKEVADSYIREIQRRNTNFNDYLKAASIIAEGPSLRDVDCTGWDSPQVKPADEFTFTPHCTPPDRCVEPTLTVQGSELFGTMFDTGSSAGSVLDESEILSDEDIKNLKKPNGLSCEAWVSAVHKAWANDPIIVLLTGAAFIPIMTLVVVPLLKNFLGAVTGLLGLRKERDQRLSDKADKLVEKVGTKEDKENVAKALDVLSAADSDSRQKIVTAITQVVSKRDKVDFAEESTAPTIAPQNLSSDPREGEYKTKREKSKKNQRKSVSKGYRATRWLHNHGGEVEVQSQTTDDIAAKCRKAMYNMYVVDGDREQFIGTVWGIVGNAFLMPKHYLAVMENSMDRGVFKPTMLVRLRSHENPSFALADLTLGAFVDLEKAFDDNEDLSLVKLPSNCSVFDLRRYLITEDELDMIESGQVIFEYPKRNAGDERRRERTTFTKHSRIVPHNPACPDDVFALDRPLKVSAHTTKGDCGAMVLLDDWGSLQAHRLIGFHVAGGNNYAFVCVPTRERVEMLLSVLDDDPGGAEEYPFGVETPAVVECAPVHLGGCTIRPIMRLSRGYYANSKSNLKRTPMYGKLWELNKFPSLLRPKLLGGIEINPWAKAVGKYDLKPLPYISEQEAHIAAHIAFEPFMRLTPQPSDDCNRMSYTRYVPDLEESIKGTPRLPYLKPINRRTSPGFPWNMAGYTSKRDFFGHGDEYTFDNVHYPRLKAEVERCESMLKNGIRPFFVYTDSLKDELRPLEKVCAGETRLISGAPLHLVILTRKYFGAFINAVVATRIDNGVAVGIDYVKEWSNLALRLESKGGQVFAGDYKAFDARCQPAIHDAILKQINAWYGDEFSRVRELLWLEITNSRHLCSENGGPRETIYEWLGSMPSGNVLTAILNSFYSLTLFVLTYRDIKGDVYDFWDHVCPVTYGDDNVVAVDPFIAEEFNQRTIAGLMDKFGAKYQMETKKDDECAPPTRPLEDVQFLKRGFVRTGFTGDWLCPLDIDTIRAITSYTVAKVVDDDVMRQLVDTSMREFSLHDKDVWESNATKLYSEAVRSGVPVQLPPVQWRWRNMVLTDGINYAESAGPPGLDTQP